MSDPVCIDTVIALERMAIERAAVSMNAWINQPREARKTARDQVFALLDECREDYEGK